jgi:hypothetical protein
MREGFPLTEVLKKPPLSVSQWGNQMDKRLFICAAIFLILALLALLVYNNLEIFEDKAYSLPSREVRANNFYALEKWLKETGYPVRIEKQCTPEIISKIPETAAVVFAKAGEWEDAQKFLRPWIERGNSLVICIDYNYINEMDDHLLEFLSGFGIEVGITYEISREEDIPDFDFDINFTIENDTEIFTIKDANGLIALAEVYPGKGTLTITGYPHFMQNRYLEKEKNARLSWRLTGERAGNDGVFFVRERQTVNSIFGKIMERGNLVPLGISIFLIIIIGFWMVIPVFGLVFEEKQKNSRPIRERFAAEISFLKKYKSLDYYLEIYDREKLSEELIKKEDNYSYREIINKLRRVYNETDKLKHRVGGYKA